MINMKYDLIISIKSSIQILKSFLSFKKFNFLINFYFLSF